MPLRNKTFENNVGKGEIARNEQFLLFPQCFSTLLDNFLPFSSNLNCGLQTFSVWKSLKFVVWERVKGMYLHVSVFYICISKYLEIQMVAAGYITLILQSTDQIFICFWKVWNRSDCTKDDFDILTKIESADSFTNWLIDLWCWMPFSTVFQLYHGS